jgi:hypothetical protein
MSDWVIFEPKTVTETVPFDWFINDILVGGGYRDNNDVFSQFATDLYRSRYTINGTSFINPDNVREVLKKLIPRKRLRQMVYVLGTQSVLSFVLERLTKYCNEGAGAEEHIIIAELPLSGSEDDYTGMVTAIDIYEYPERPDDPHILISIRKDMRKLRLSGKEVSDAGYANIMMYIDLGVGNVIYGLEFD